MIVLSFPFQERTVSASAAKDVDKELEELEEEKKELEKEQGNLEKKKGSTDKEMDDNKSEQSAVETDMQTIDDKLTTTLNDINDTEEEITNLEEEITNLGDQIDELDGDIDDLIERIKERDELLKNRLRSIQETGGQSHYIEVLFGSQSFSDFISRASAVNTIMDQDVKIMEEQEEDKASLEGKLEEVKDKKETVEASKEEVEVQKEELTALKATLDDQLDEKETLMAELEIEYEELDDYKLTLEEEQKIVQEQEASLKKAEEAAVAEKERLQQLAKEEERKKKEAEAQKKKQQEQEAATPPNNDGNAPQTENAGTFMWPSTSTRVTSSFGPRVHPVTGVVGKMHHGIDLGVKQAPVYASATGVVSSTRSMTGYGNTVILTHKIDGKTYTTLYAHLESISVSPGDVVKQGDHIATSGNSGGSSTGFHLHFEIHTGQWNASKSNATNPLSYLP